MFVLFVIVLYCVAFYDVVHVCCCFVFDVRRVFLLVISICFVFVLVMFVVL